MANKSDYVYSLINMIEPHVENDRYYAMFLKLERYLKDGKDFKLNVNDKDLLHALINRYSTQKECDTINFFLKHKYYYADKNGKVFYKDGDYVTEVD